MKLIELKSENLEELIDITDEVNNFVQESGIENGTITVQTINNTCSVISMSSQLGDVSKNFFATMNKLYPIMDGMKFIGYDIRCIRSGIIGTSKTFIIAGGQIVLGPFEKIYLAEFSGPSDKLFVVCEATGIDVNLTLENNPALAVAEFKAEIMEEKERQQLEEQRALQEMREEWAREHANDPRFIKEEEKAEEKEVKEEEES